MSNSIPTPKLDSYLVALDAIAAQFTHVQIAFQQTQDAHAKVQHEATLLALQEQYEFLSRLFYLEQQQKLNSLLNPPSAPSAPPITPVAGQTPPAEPPKKAVKECYCDSHDLLKNMGCDGKCCKPGIFKWAF